MYYNLYVTKNICLETTSAYEFSDMLLMKYNMYVGSQINDLELRGRPIHPDGGSIKYVLGRQFNILLTMASF